MKHIQVMNQETKFNTVSFSYMYIVLAYFTGKGTVNSVP